MMSDEQYPVIRDPLAWQRVADVAGLGLNIRGSERFWRTLAEYGLVAVHRDGTPELSRVVFALTDTLGVEFKAEAYPTDPDDQAGGAWLKFRFVELVSDSNE